LPVRTFTHTSTTAGNNPCLRNETKRLSWIVQNPASESTQYLVNTASDTTNTGLIFNAGDTMRMNWFDDGNNVNHRLVFITSTGTADLKVVETLAENQEEYDRITRGRAR
jgi:hypothetical protein